MKTFVHIYKVEPHGCVSNFVITKLPLHILGNSLDILVIIIKSCLFIAHWWYCINNVFPMLEMQQYPGMCMNVYHKLLPEIPFNYNSFLSQLHPSHQQLFKSHVKCILHIFSPHFLKKTKCWHLTVGILIELTVLIKTIQSSYNTNVKSKQSLLL